jgi:hypothetical protein
MIPGLLHCTCVGEYIWGTISSLGAFAESVGNMPNISWFYLYEFMVLAGRKTKIHWLVGLGERTYILINQ